MIRYTLTKLSLGFLIFLLSWAGAQAQRSEVGFGIGTFNYTGDLVHHYNFKYSRPAATVFYRSNLSNVVSFRTSLTGGQLSASDKPMDAFAQQRDASFDIFLMEVSTVLEYHFLDWRDSRRFVRLNPYLFGGVGLFGISGEAEKKEEYSNVQVSIPFGLGIKYVYNPKWYFGLELGVRKTFFDNLDNISGGDLRYKNYQYGNPNDNDTFYYLGISLTRTFYEIPCPRSPYK